MKMNRTNFFSIATGTFLFYAFLVLSAGPSFAESGNSAQATRFYNDGLQLSQAKYWKEAAHEFRKAIQHDPKHKLAFANLGVALSQIGQHKEALLAFEEAMNLGYDHALLRYNRGLSFAKLNLIEEAVKEIKISLKMDFRNVKAIYDLGLLYLAQEQVEETRKLVDLLYHRNNALAKKLFDKTPLEYKVVSVENGGTLSGSVTMKGKVPDPRFFPLIASPNIEYCTRISNGRGHRILFDFTVSKSRGLKDTVIKLTGVPKGKPFTTGVQKVVMDRCHTPNYTIGVRNGETLLVENTDPIIHEVVTYEFTNRGVDQRSHRPVNAHTSQIRSAFVKRGTEEFLLKCNLHPFLQTRGLMVDNPYYAITDEEGRFSIKDIPPGTYEVVAWHPFIPNQVGTITIEPGQQSKLDFEFDGGDVRRKLYNDDWAMYHFQAMYDSFENFYGGPRIDDKIEVLQKYIPLKN